MAKGLSVNFSSYGDTIPKLLTLVNLEREIKKYSSVVIKPFISSLPNKSVQNTPIELVEEVLKFCLDKRNPVSEVFIAEGADGEDTMELFKEHGYSKLAEKYSVGLIDLNNTEVEPVESPYYTKFKEIFYPKILQNSFVISLPKLASDDEFIFNGSMSNMLGAFPMSYYKGFFSKGKSKIRKWSIKYSIHDIIQCKMPEFALVDATEKGKILAGFPLEVDKQAAKLLNLDWKQVSYIRLLEQNYKPKPSKEEIEKRRAEAKMPELVN